MLNQLSSLSSPLLPSTPLTIVSSDHRDQDLAALRSVAPRAVVRSGSLRASANRNTVFVLDRCGRMVYQQTLQQSDTNLQSVEAAIFSAHLDEPCGPCHLPLQEETSQGRSNQIQDKTTSQAKMSGIANAYGLSSVANIPTDETRREKTVIEEIVAYDRRDEPEEEIVFETTRKPERKKKKKDKLKKGKHEKQKKRKRVEDPETSTSKPTEAGSNNGCDRDCDVRAKDFSDEIEKLIGLSETDNEILRPFPPSSAITWADGGRHSIQDKRKKQNKKNGKRAQAELEREIDEGIEMVREEEELVEYPDTIGGDDNVLAAIAKAVGEVRVSEIRWGSENGLSREDGDVGFATDDDRILVADDRVALPDETVYRREREQEEESTHRRDESKDAGEKKRRKKSKDASKKGRKTKKRVEEIREKERNVEDEWVGLYETDSQESLIPWPVKELDVGIVAERETDGGQFAEREMDGGQFTDREMDESRFAQREMYDGQFTDREIDGGQFPEREMDESRFAQREMDDGQSTDREMDEGQFPEREIDDGQFAEREMNGGSFAENEMDGGRFRERETDDSRFAEREMDESRFTEREPESAPRYVAWREATVVPTEHNSRSSGSDSSDRNSRIAVYASAGDYSTSDKVEQLHSKVKPWGKEKHY